MTKKTETQTDVQEKNPIVEMNIFQRLHAIMSEVETLSKDGTNKFHKYDYVTESQYVKAIRPLLKKYRVVMYQQVRQIIPDPKREDLMHIQAVFVFVNIDSPNEIVETSIAASGSDNGDKAIYKALTGAKKYTLATTFMTATGDDAEGDEKVDEKAAQKSFAAKPATTAPKSNGFSKAVEKKGFGV